MPDDSTTVTPSAVLQEAVSVLGSTTTPTVTPSATATPTGTEAPEDKVVEANAQADVPEANATNNRLSGRLSGQGFLVHLRSFVATMSQKSSRIQDTNYAS